MKPTYNEANIASCNSIRSTWTQCLSFALLFFYNDNEWLYYVSPRRYVYQVTHIRRSGLFHLTPSSLAIHALAFVWHNVSAAIITQTTAR